MTKKIAQVVVGLPVEGPFDYAIGDDLKEKITVGNRVRVSFNRRKRVGYVVGLKQKSEFKRLNPIIDLLDTSPAIDEQALKLSKQFNEYYGCSLGEAIETYLPRALRKNKLAEVVQQPTRSQSQDKESGAYVLVHDKGREQRWEYLYQEIASTIKKKKSIIFCVPEIVYIKTVQKRLAEQFKEYIVTIDKKLNPAKELELWNSIKIDSPHIIIGTRSAIFAPTQNLGLIVVFNEENESYKQEQTPHYHVHEVAQMRHDIEGCKVVFVSSIPTVELWNTAQKKKWEIKEFDFESDCTVQVVDMTNYNPAKSSVLSFPLQNALTKTLEEGGRAVLLMNRRGFSTRTSCNQCGHVMQCERCFANLTYLYSHKMLECRHCNYKTELPKICPKCKSKYMRSTGTGIEKLESEVARLYPHVKVHIYDKETKAFPKKADVIIATQAFFNVQNDIKFDLSAILNFDRELNYMDFRSAQRAFSLLVYLRQRTQKKLVVQTRMIDNYCLKAATKMDFTKFYREELKFRKELNLPPYIHLVDIGIRSPKEEDVHSQSALLYKKFTSDTPAGIDVSDPRPDVLPKLRDQYRYVITLKGSSVKKVLSFVKKALKNFRKKSTIITINVDP